MSKSLYSNSNLYMTTEEFANLVIDALDEQNYFKKDAVAHPQDIAYAFSTVGETIGSAMAWAIKQEAEYNRKIAMMQSSDIKKDSVTTDDGTNYYSDHLLAKAYKGAKK